MQRQVRCQHDRRSTDNERSDEYEAHSRIGSLTAGLAVGLALTVSTALGQSPPSPKALCRIRWDFVFRQTGFIGLMEFSPSQWSMSAQFGPDWYKQADRLPPIESVQTVARQAQQKGAPVVLDIEHWPLEGSPDVVQSSLQKYMTVLTWFQNAAPGLSVGYYGAPPIRDYWRAIKGPTSQEYRVLDG